MEPVRITPFLNTCPATIRQAFEEVRFQAGDMILTQGDAPGYVYVLIEGEARVCHLTMNGIQYLEYVYTDGELFGEIEVLNHKEIIADVHASSSCTTLRIASADFIRWLNADPEFSLFICRQLADKLYNACLSSVANIAYPLKYRVLYFLWNATQNGNSTVRKEDIITGAGSNERSINRILKELSGTGLITSEPGLVKIGARVLLLQAMRKYE